MILTCQNTACGKQFNSRKSRQKCCSRECSADILRAQRPTRTCAYAQCGKTLQVKPSKAKRLYCGKACVDADRSLQEKTCAAEGCGKTFRPKHQQSKYCSRACGFTSPLRVRGRKRKPEIKCEECSQLFHPRNPRQRFCSRTCGHAGQSRGGNPNPKPGRGGNTRGRGVPALPPASPPSVEIPPRPEQPSRPPWRPAGWAPQPATRRAS